MLSLAQPSSSLLLFFFLERCFQKEVGQEEEKDKGLIGQKMKRAGEKKWTDSKRTKKNATQWMWWVHLFFLCHQFLHFSHLFKMSDT